MINQFQAYAVIYFILIYVSIAHDDIVAQETYEFQHPEYINQDTQLDLIIAMDNLNLTREAMSKTLDSKKIESSISRFIMKSKAAHAEGDFKKSIWIADQAIKVIANEKYHKQRVELLGLKAAAYYYLGHPKKAVESSLKALRYCEIIKDSVGMSTSLSDVGTIYLLMNNNVDALNYLLKSYDISRSIKDTSHLIDISNNIGSTYLQIDNYVLAMKYHQAALNMSYEICNSVQMAWSKCYLGKLYVKIGDFSKAKKILKTAYIDAKILREYVLLMEIGAVYGEAYMNMSNFDAAINILKETLILSEEQGVRSKMNACHRMLSSCYQKKKSYELAFVHLSKSMILKDSIYESNQIKEMESLRLSYEEDKRQRELKALVLLEAKKKSKRDHKIYLGITLFIILFSFVTIKFARIRASQTILDASMLIILLLSFRLLMLMFEPLVSNITGTNPALKWICNVMIALLLIPLKKFLIVQLTPSIK